MRCSTPPPPYCIKLTNGYGTLPPSSYRNSDFPRRKTICLPYPLSSLFNNADNIASTRSEHIFFIFHSFSDFFFSTNFFIKRSQKNQKRCSDSVLIHLNFVNILSFGFVLDIADVCWLFTTVVTHSRPFVI